MTATAYSSEVNRHWFLTYLMLWAKTRLVFSTFLSKIRPLIPKKTINKTKLCRLHFAWLCPNKEAPLGVFCPFIAKRGCVFELMDLGAVLIISTSRVFIPFSSFSLLISNELAMTICEAESKRNTYSMFMMFKANQKWGEVDPSNTPSELVLM